jgi:hypothetical protein
MRALVLILLGCASVPTVPITGIRLPNPGIPPTYWTAESPREAAWIRPAILCDGLLLPVWNGRYWHCPVMGPRQ